MRAVFLDLNGTLVMPVRVTHPREYTLIPGAIDAIRLLNQHGFICPIVTVQSRIAKGIYSLDDFHTWFRCFQVDLGRHDASVTGPYVCPHQGRDMCSCKKPQSLLYRQAAADHGITLGLSAIIGDTTDDVCVAHELRCVGCLVRTGWGEHQLREQAASAVATYVAEDVLDAARWIVTQHE